MTTHKNILLILFFLLVVNIAKTNNFTNFSSENNYLSSKINLNNKLSNSSNLNYFLLGDSTKKDNFLGLTFSGGGAKGLAYIGMMEVIESTGMPIHYISGTSIGSIMGGLFALGYSTAYIRELMANQDWSYLIGNKIDKKNMSLNEKRLRTNYIFTLSIEKNFKIKDRVGFLYGQHIDDLFSRLYSPFYYITDFSEFPIPFVCVAVDLVTGEDKEITSGYFPDAIRASIAIPIAFTPKIIEDIVFIDGGFVNNFPATNLKKRGIEYIIGLDVQHRLLSPDSISTLLDVTRQYMDLNRLKSNIAGRNNANILIRPDIESITIADFSKADDIVQKGYDAALEYRDTLKYISDSIQNLGYQPYRFINTKPLDSVYVEKLTYRGLKYINPNIVTQILTFNVPGYVTLDNIELTLEKLRGTYNFESVTYQLAPGSSIERAELIFRFKEELFNTVSVGFNYNNIKYSTLMANATYRNFLYHGSFFSLDLGISTYPYLYATYMATQSNLFNPGLSLKVYSLPYNIYNEEYKLINKSFFLNSISDLFIRSDLSSNMYFKNGVTFETYSRINRLISIEYSDFFRPDNYCLSAYSQFNLNTIDDMFFPTTGLLLDLKAKYIIKDFSLEDFKPIFTAQLDALFSETINLKKIKVTFNTNINMGITLFSQKFNPYYNELNDFYYFNPHSYYLGGSNSVGFMNQVVFGGYEFMAKKTNNIIKINEELLCEFLKNHYASVSFGVSTLTDNIYEGLIDYSNLHSYIGLSYGYKFSAIPFKISINKSLNYKGLFVNLTVGRSLN
ncbi:MAG: patatin-like phospholipase family protein [Bacteroidales bacterium]